MDRILASSKVIKFLKRALEQQSRKDKSYNRKSAKVQQIRQDGSQSHALEQHSFKTVHRIAERINNRNPLQPLGKSLNGINGPAGKIQKRIQNAEDGARNQRIVYTYHH